MKFLFLEPFYGGSHRSFADGWVAHSRHSIDLMTLPARFWKWRMRGAALHFFRKLPALEGYRGLITTDLMSLADFKALTSKHCPPALVYFHENQLTYPLAPGEHMDFQFGFTDITTALTADKVLFNSHTHLSSFFSQLPKFLKMMPEYQPHWVVDAIQRKSEVLYPGCQFEAREQDLAPHLSPSVKPPLIIWNHRWEFDKDPATFFEVLETIRQKKVPFRLAVGKISG